MATKKKHVPEANIYDYLNWRGDLSFSAVPVGEVDNLIFSMLTYIDMSGVVPEHLERGERPQTLLEMTRRYLRVYSGKYKSIGLMIPKEILVLLVRAAKTQRFGTTRPFFYAEKLCDKEQMQFSATSFLLPGGDIFVAFRGTDDTLVGWKENFNMSFMHPVPAQREAQRYLERVAAATKGRLFVGGHSKGGNLAVYAAAKASEATKSRIVTVYNNDGPGFDRAFITGKAYLSIRDRVHTLLPQSSIVGMLLEHEEQFTVVKSTKVLGLNQHNGLTWLVSGAQFIHLDDVNGRSRWISEKVKLFLEHLTVDQRERFVDAIYTALSSTSAKTLSELNDDKLKILKAWNSMDDETRTYLKRTLALILGRSGQKEVKLSEKKNEQRNRRKG